MFRMVTHRIKKLIAWAIALGVLGFVALGVYALVWLL